MQEKERLLFYATSRHTWRPAQLTNINWKSSGPGPGIAISLTQPYNANTNDSYFNKQGEWNMALRARSSLALLAMAATTLAGCASSGPDTASTEPATRASVGLPPRRLICTQINWQNSNQLFQRSNSGTNV